MRNISSLPALAIVGMLFGAQPAQILRAQEPPKAGEKADHTASLVEVLERFDGSVNLRAPKGAAAAHVQIHNWTIRNDQTVTSFPLRGLLVMELRGGELTTVIDGERTPREPGAFWVVGERASLTLITGNDTATLQVTAIQ